LCSAYSNTEYENLFEALNTQAHIDKTHPGLASILEIMESWTTQPGFPLIRVQQVFQKMFYVSQVSLNFIILNKNVCLNHVSKLQYVQERFRKSSSWDKAENETVSELWNCPIFIATSADVDRTVQRRPEFWLTNKEVTKSWVSNFSVDWIIVNVHSSGTPSFCTQL